MFYLQLLLNGISLGSVYALIALGFTLIYSILKFSNFSHGGVMVVSAYIGFVFAGTLKMNFPMMLILSALVGGSISCLVQFIGFERLRKTNGSVMLYFVSSSTMGILLQNLIAITFSSNYYSYPMFFKKSFFQLGGITIAVTDLMMLVISAISISILMFVLYRTRIGVSIRALSMDSNAAKLMGINVSLIVAMTFFISGVLGAVSGVFCGMNYSLYPQLGNLVLKGMIASILGGLGNISGALYGGLLLGLAEIFLINFVGSGITPVFTFVLFILFLMIRPQGISGKFISEKV
jgi:branched-chain amino acid transport system permease protein